MKQVYQLFYLSLILFVVCGSVTAQKYVPDPSFQSPTFRNPGGNINTIATQPDGKILIGGSMQYINGIQNRGIARLNQDGSIDESFQPQINQQSEISSIKLLSNGKIVLSGTFYDIGEDTKRKLLCLNADGGIDAAFKTIEGQVTLLAVQADNKILIRMPVMQGDLTSSYKLIRLHPDGRPDDAFNADEKITNRGVYTIEVQPDGKIIVAGEPTSVNGIISNTLIRLLPDGSLDNTFSFAEVSQKLVLFTVLLQSDGKMLVGGFSEAPIPYKTYIKRINSDGSIDTTFQPAAFPVNGMVLSLDKQADGKLLAGGWFYTPNPNAVPYGWYHSATNLSPVYRLEVDGSLDNTFTVDSKVVNFAAYAVKALPDGRILAGNSPAFAGFVGVNVSLINAILCLNNNGSLNESFIGEVEVDGVIFQITPQPAGKILATGSFKKVGNKKREGLVQINMDGSVDDTFVPSTDLPPVGYSIPKVVNQPDGKLLVGGIYNNKSGVYKRLYRLKPDGTIDNSFNASNASVSRMYITNMVVLPDNKIVVGGGSLEYNEFSSYKIARVYPDGSEDIAFKKETGFGDGYINAMVLQADGKMLVADGYQDGKWSTRYFNRINSDGSIDKSFKAPAWAVDSLVTLTSVAIQADKKIIVSGLNAPYLAHTYIIRMNEDGSIDTSYKISDFERSDCSIVLQPDGKAIAYGYSHIRQKSNVMRLNTDGSVDTSLEVGEMPGVISTLSLLPENKMMYSTSGRLVKLVPVQEQTISFATIGDKLFSDAPFSLTATASSGLPVTFAVVSGPATITSNIVTLTGVGTVTIRASQAGNLAYKAAPEVDKIFEVKTVLGIEEYTASIKIYPNPSQGSFTIELPDELRQATLQIVNQQGQKIMVKYVAMHNDITVQTDNLPAGMYLLYLYHGKDAIIRKMIVR